MRFLIVTNVIHKYDENLYYAYGPYVKEMNIWFKHVDEVEIIAPLTQNVKDPIDISYKHDNLIFTKVPDFNLSSFYNKLKTLFVLPYLLIKLYISMKRADHIHLRCPNNMGLLGSVVQILFPSKTKTAKYANNWDPNHPQPLTYRLQKKILRSELLTKNMKTLVYGDWKDKSINIKPFFTATYKDCEKEIIDEKNLNDKIKFIFVGTLTENKRPMLCLEFCKKLKDEEFNFEFNFFGEGKQKDELLAYVKLNNLSDFVVIHGNKNSEVVKTYLKEANFLILASMSEGWPKVVAEAMFWGTVPFVTNVSCTRYMIGSESRGKIIEPNVDSIFNAFLFYLNNKQEFIIASKNAMEWSRKYTLDLFEEEIKVLING